MSDLPNTDEILKVVINIKLDYTKNKIKKRELMKKYSAFRIKYPTLFDKALKDEPISILIKQLRLVERVKKGEISLDQADLLMNKMVMKEYVPHDLLNKEYFPELDKEKDKE